MARKRAPGAGRPPRGEIRNKNATLTTRITVETRQALEAAAKRHRRSISQEAEVALRAYLKRPEGEARNRALALVVNNLAENIEKQTGAGWRRDAFTGEALRSAINAILIYFAPDVEESVPPRIEEQAAKMPEELAARYRTPAGLGALHAFHLVTEIESRPKPGKMVDEWSLPLSLNFDSLGLLDIVARDLGA
jgi:hypothetical protein